MRFAAVHTGPIPSDVCARTNAFFRGRNCVVFTEENPDEGGKNPSTVNFLLPGRNNARHIVVEG
jgi:hypothetical protein